MVAFRFSRRLHTIRLDQFLKGFWYSTPGSNITWYLIPGSNIPGTSSQAGHPWAILEVLKAVPGSPAMKLQNML